MRLKKRIFFIVFLLLLWFAVKHLYDVYWSIINQQWRFSFINTGELTMTVEPVKNGSITSLNLHTWSLDCKCSLESFRNYPLFPIAPQFQKFINPFHTFDENTKLNGKFIADRIFGFIYAPTTGIYVFHLTTAGDGELLLGKSWQSLQPVSYTNPDRSKRSKNTIHISQNNSRILIISRNNILNISQNNSWISAAEKPRISYVSNSENSSGISPDIFLEKGGLYCLELLHIHKAGKRTINVKWKLPDSYRFTEIKTNYFRPFITENVGIEKLSESTTKKDHTGRSILENTKFLKDYLTYIKPNAVNVALNICRYARGYVERPVTSDYIAVSKFMNPTFVYPEIKHSSLKDGKWIPWFPLGEKDAAEIAEKYMKHLELAYPGNYELVKILNVERKSNVFSEMLDFKNEVKLGDRYLLELQLQDKEKNKNVILSRYVYNDLKKAGVLCYPEGFQWNMLTPVYLLVSVQKQGAWVLHLIKNIQDIYVKTKDENLHLILYDYHSTDINIEKELETSLFKNYRVLKATDRNYSRAYSLNKAAQAVSNHQSIIFTIDLHLEIPATFPNNIRKHCIEGKSVYTPIIARLACGATPDDPAGSWDPWGYGMFGAYKSDWDRFHGFDDVKYTTKWGGEDWDLIDRAYKVGLEFERIKHADIYHYYHTRNGMW